MHLHEERLREFYLRFAARDAEGMVRCHHPEIVFSDPIFPLLRGAEAGDMWRMLLGCAADLEVTLEALSADEEGAEARWRARYTFGRTARPVLNCVHSIFAFRDGLIVRHYDHFSLWRWAGQAYGTFGRALGWCAPFKWKVRKEAAGALAKFRASRWEAL